MRGMVELKENTQPVKKHESNDKSISGPILSHAKLTMTPNQVIRRVELHGSLLRVTRNIFLASVIEPFLDNAVCK